MRKDAATPPASRHQRESEPGPSGRSAWSGSAHGAILAYSDYIWLRHVVDALVLALRDGADVLCHRGTAPA